ncbi:MAG: M48 family peptidase, partial [Candidatus Marinimicrobia bacterium]|nr:M48 family peptidase [Candidatus Neomarinimicrobiota bacterium]
MNWLPWSPYLALVIGLVLLRYALAAWLNALDLRRDRGGVPPEFADRCTPEQYARALDYHRASLRFDWLRQTVMTAVTLLFILAGGLTVIDHLARATADHLIGAGLVFIGSLILLNRLLDIPFDLWETFRLEARFGFNRTTPRTFVLDELKGLLLLVLIGAPLLALLLWFFS